MHLISSIVCILVFINLSSALVSSTTVVPAPPKCRTDIMSCQGNFTADVHKANGNTTLECAAGRAYNACLDVSDNAPECAVVKSEIATMRQSIATTINTDCSATNDPNSARVNCNRDVRDCESRFVVAYARAGSDVSKGCAAGAQLKLCLSEAEQSVYCVGFKNVVDLVRDSYKKQMDADGCGNAPAPTVTKCQGDVLSCQRAFDQAVANNKDNDVQQCNDGAIYMKCLDQFDKSPACASAKVVISDMRNAFSAQIQAAGCGSGSKPTVTQCQGEIMACQRKFSTDMGTAGENVDAQCSAGAAFTQCLDQKDAVPECASVKSTIADMRTNFKDQIKKDGCGNINPSNPKVQCAEDIDNCEVTFTQATTAAGTDINKRCVAGATLEQCLQGIEKDTDCKSALSVINTLRKTYKDQIDQSACSSPASKACVIGIQNCTQTYQQSVPTQTTDDQKCTTANAMIDCLNDLSCSSSFKLQIKQVYDMVHGEIVATKSTCKLHSIGGHASALSVSTFSTLMGLVASLYLVLCVRV